MAHSELEQIQTRTADLEEWYRITLHRLTELCRLVSMKYSRPKARRALPEEYAGIIEELLHTQPGEEACGISAANAPL